MKTKRRLTILSTLLLLFATGLLLKTSPWRSEGTAEQLKQQTFHNLKKIHQQKKKAISSLLNKQEKKARTIADDAQMREYFDTMARRNNNPEIELAVDRRYVEKYGDFYDILFIDPRGVVFHSIKKESDYKKNLFSPPFVGSSLSRALSSSPDNDFAEFEFYAPSNESAAFFIVPLQHDERGKKIAGWFALQFAANSLNGILTDRKKLGQTGEVYLVNKNNLMLTDSRFFQKSTILREKITTEAVTLAFQQGHGEKIIQDYRGAQVFSTFEKIDVLGAEWVLIAEIDEDEVLTKYYQKHKKKLLDRIITSSQNPQHKGANTKYFVGRYDIRVDMNEFKRVDREQTLATFGVTTCTAVAVLKPGNFGYLTHLSPTDDVYMENWLSPFISFWQGRKYFNLLEELFSQLSHYDVYPYQRRELQVFIIAPHRKSVEKVIDAVLDKGLYLSNIKILHNTKAQSANVLLDVNNNKIIVDWQTQKGITHEQDSQVLNLATALKNVIGYQS